MQIQKRCQYFCDIGILVSKNGWKENQDQNCANQGHFAVLFSICAKLVLLLLMGQERDPYQPHTLHSFL